MNKVFYLSCLLICGLSIGKVATGQDVVMGANVDFGVTPSPNNLVLELRTASNQSVSWTLNGLQSQGTSGGTINRSVRADTAASMGVDWTAWSAAVIDLAYNRFVVTFNGITEETPWPVTRHTPFELDRLGVGLGGWAWPQTSNNSKIVGIGLSAIDEAVVPEPGAFLLAFLVMLAVGFQRHRQCS